MSDTERDYTGIVLYTDGSARPNPGYTGWGSHGYKYTTEKSQKGAGLDGHQLTTNGYVATINKGTSEHKSITGVTPVEYYDFFGSDKNTQTNNAAEIDALIHSLTNIKLEGISVIQIFTDSDYVRRGLCEWIPIWQRQNWIKRDGTQIANVDKWRRLHELVDHITNTLKINFLIDWVKGHSGLLGNEIADKLASIATSYAMDGIHANNLTVTPPQGYWKRTVTRHPLIGFKRLYFNSTNQLNRPGHYYLVEPGTDELHIGSRVPEASYCVLHLYQPESVIEDIRNHQASVSNDIVSIMLMRLDKVYSKAVYPYLVEHGKYALMQNIKGTIGLNFVDNEPVTIERNPAGLSMRAIEIYSFLDEILDHYKNNTLLTKRQHYGFEIHDITSTFFDTPQNTNIKKPKWLPNIIYSGGQTGVDVAGLDWGIENNINVGGWCPKDRLNEVGTIPLHYPLTETSSRHWTMRTHKNIEDSDATLIINQGTLRSGTLMTFNRCNEVQKPVYVVNLDSSTLDQDIGNLIEWLKEGQYKILNIAGPRESKCKGIYDKSMALLRKVFQNPSQPYSLKPEYIVGFMKKTVDITIWRDETQNIKQTIPITLYLGLDLPIRNHLKKLEPLVPKIELITWKESDSVVRHCTVVNTCDGVGIWSNFFADRIILS